MHILNSHKSSSKNVSMNSSKNSTEISTNNSSMNSSRILLSLFYRKSIRPFFWKTMPLDFPKANFWPITLTWISRLYWTKWNGWNIKKWHFIILHQFVADMHKNPTTVIRMMKKNKEGFYDWQREVENAMRDLWSLFHNKTQLGSLLW